MGKTFSKRLTTMIKKLYAAYKRAGLLGFLYLFTTRITLNLLAFPIASIIIIVFPIIKIRLIRLFSYRVGHYALNTELLLCAKDSNLFNEKKRSFFWFYTPPNEPICNEQLHKMWKRKIFILPFSSLWRQVDIFLGTSGT